MSADNRDKIIFSSIFQKKNGSIVALCFLIFNFGWLVCMRIYLYDTNDRICYFSIVYTGAISHFLFVCLMRFCHYFVAHFRFQFQFRFNWISHDTYEPKWLWLMQRHGYKYVLCVSVFIISYYFTICDILWSSVNST